MEEILKELMNIKCVSMHNNQFRCYNKGCDGQCAQFQVALFQLDTLLQQERYNNDNSRENK